MIDGQLPGGAMAEEIEEASAGAEGVRWFFLWRTLLRFVVPAVLTVVLVLALGDTWKAITGLFVSPA